MPTTIEPIARARSEISADVRYSAIPHAPNPNAVMVEAATKTIWKILNDKTSTHNLV